MATASDVLILRPSKGFLRLDLNALWEYRELLKFLVCVISKSAISRRSWVLPGRSQPLLTMVVFSVFFGRLAKCPRTAFPILSSPMPRWCPGSFSPPPEARPEQPGRQPEPDHQSIFPAPCDSDRRVAGRSG